MTTAIKPESFASAGNYPAGSDDWNAQPRKLALTASEKAQGFTPNTPIGAEVRNGLHADHYETRSLLALRGMQEWRKTDLPVTQSGAAHIFSHLVGVRLGAGSKERGIVAIGYDTNAANVFTYMLGVAGKFRTNVSVTPNTGPRAACEGSIGEWIISTASLISGRQQLDHVVTNDVLSNVSAVHYAPGSSSPYLAVTSAGTFHKGASNAALSAATNPAGLTACAASSLGTPAGEFADDGGLNVVYAGSCTIAGLTRFRILRSGDGGATWTSVFTGGSSATHIGVAWQAASSRFVATYGPNATSFFAMFSSDGSTWSAGPTVTLSGLSARHKTLAVAGNCIAKAVDVAYFTTTIGAIAYSFDDGASWRLTHVDVDLPIKCLASINSRIYAITDAGFLFSSGTLAYEDKDL